MFRKFYNIVNSFFWEPAMQSSEFFIKKYRFSLKYQCGRIHLYCNFKLQDWKSTNKVFPNKQAKSFKNTKKGVLFLSETHCKHRKHISISIHNVYAPTTHQMNINQFKIFGAIASLICHLPHIVRGHMKTITVNSSRPVHFRKLC